MKLPPALARCIGILLLSALLWNLALRPAAAQEERSATGNSAQIFNTFAVGNSEPFFDLSHEDNLLRGLSVSGFFLNTSGMWVNSSALTRFGRDAGEHHGANSLAVERELVQLDANLELNADNHFFLRFWGVYEPPYPWEAHNIAGPDLLFNRSQSQIYNRYDVREAYWKTTSGPLTLFTGRQIVTWGESITFRVGDVINPQDLSWNFGFANLEQSRLPLWMLHPILSLPQAGPLSSNFLEGIWTPACQPLYTGISYVDQRYSGQSDVAGAVNLLPPSGGRFDPYPYPFSIPALTPPGARPAFPQVRVTTPSQTFRLPSDTWANSTEGFRIHTLLANAELTAFYWHAHQFNPTPYIIGNASSGQNFQFRYPELNDLGVTLNRPIYLGGEMLSGLPLVLRTEGVWQDRTPFNTLNPARPSAVIHSSTINTLLALDIDSLDVPWLSSTGALTTNFEWNNYSILSPNKGMVYSGYAERWRHNEENVLLSASTSWWWGAVVPTWTSIFNSDGDTWELFPSVELTPPWTSRYSLTLQYIATLGNDKFSAYAGGTFKGKNLLLLQFQYNFDLIRGRS